MTLSDMTLSNKPVDKPWGVQIRRDEIKPEETISLRHSVLWPDMPISHVILPEDQNGFHFGAFVERETEPIAVISFFIEDVPDNKDILPEIPDGAQARFRKFACDPKWQGQGIGTELLRFSREWMRELKCKLIWCDARTSTSEWYIKRGMKPFGDKFYKGPIEYTRMYAEI